MFKLCYFVPESHLSVTKQALFEAGAGKIGDYEHCAWQCKGQGQFRPLEGSNPFLGQRGELEMVAEYKVELACAEAHIQGAIEALKQAHPYEEPAYEVLRVETF